jgi:hypothetical protein
LGHLLLINITQRYFFFININTYLILSSLWDAILLIFDENYTTQKNKSYQYLLSDGVGCNRFSDKVTALDVTWITGKV